MEKHSEAGEMMKKALALKLQQDLQLRKKFESYPEYVKFGLYFCEEYNHTRIRNFHEQILVSEKLKKHANVILSKKEGSMSIDEALKILYRSLTIFRYIIAKNPDYKKEGIKDTELTYMQYEPKNSSEKTQFDIHMRNIYINIAYIYLLQNRYDLCVNASDEALKLDELNALALYRKGDAVSQNINSNVTDYKSIYNQIDKVLKLGVNNHQDMNF